MRALILTNEFPPSVYGGAGVHVDYLTRELRKLIEVEVRSFAGAPADEPGWRVRAYEPGRPVTGADAGYLRDSTAQAYRRRRSFTPITCSTPTSSATRSGRRGTC